MVFLCVFTLSAISIQCILSVLVGWMTLSCRCNPQGKELQEMTLIKLLYLHDPQACGRVFFYNHTIQIRETLAETTVEWPIKNAIAASFRSKIRIWMTFHILWAIFCIGYMTQGHRPCGFYTCLIPFTLTGLAILILDLIYTVLFLTDTPHTMTEVDLLNYINVNNENIRWMNKTNIAQKPFKNWKIETKIMDTSWISLLFAYMSCRGIVQWFVNYWIVKDNYIAGLQYFRKYHKMNKAKNRKESFESIP